MDRYDPLDDDRFCVRTTISQFEAIQQERASNIGLRIGHNCIGGVVDSQSPGFSFVRWVGLDRQQRSARRSARFRS